MSSAHPQSQTHLGILFWSREILNCPMTGSPKSEIPPLLVTLSRITPLSPVHAPRVPPILLPFLMSRVTDDYYSNREIARRSAIGRRSEMLRNLRRTNGPPTSAAAGSARLDSFCCSLLSVLRAPAGALRCRARAVGSGRNQRVHVSRPRWFLPMPINT